MTLRTLRKPVGMKMRVTMTKMVFKVMRILLVKRRTPVSSVAGMVKVKNAWQMMMSSETKHAFLLLFLFLFPFSFNLFKM